MNFTKTLGFITLLLSLFTLTLDAQTVRRLSRGGVEVTPVSITTSSPLPQGEVGTAYSEGINAVGGTSPYTCTQVSGTLPTNLFLTESTCTIAGDPSAEGTFNFRIQATDTLGAQDQQDFSITINATVTPVTITTSSTLTPATENSAYSTPINTTGGTPPNTFAVIAGALPMGLNLATNGTLSGTPTEFGSFNFTIEVTDSTIPIAGTDSQVFDLTVIQEGTEGPHDWWNALCNPEIGTVLSCEDMRSDASVARLNGPTAKVDYLFDTSGDSLADPQDATRHFYSGAPNLRSSGTATAHTNGVQDCTIFFTTDVVIEESDTAGWTWFNLPDSGITGRRIIDKDNAPGALGVDFVELSPTGGCPTIPLASAQDYEAYRGAARTLSTLTIEEGWAGISQGDIFIAVDYYFPDGWDDNAVLGQSNLTHKFIQIEGDATGAGKLWEPRMIYSGTGHGSGGVSGNQDVRHYGAGVKTTADPNSTDHNVCWCTFNGDGVAEESANFSVMVQTWTRMYFLLELDYNAGNYFTWWIADENNNPIKIYDRIQMGTFGNNHTGFRWEMGTSTYTAGQYIEADMAIYTRNFVALLNYGDVTPLLTRPVR